MRDELPERPAPLPAEVVDSHCHLDIAAGYSGLAVADALSAAAAVGVTRIAQIGCDVEGSRWAVEAAQRWHNVVAGVAIHPNDAARLVAEHGATVLADGLAEIDRLARGHHRVRAVGETGLDYFRTWDVAGQRVQRESFAAHIAIAKSRDKTLVIHDRDAHADVLKVLDAEGLPERIIMHCFSGDADFAAECLARGAFLSFPGTITFNNAENLRRAWRVTPMDRVLTETDAPFLTPTPFRGRPNASYLIPHTVRFMAEARGVELATLCRALNDNAEVAFGGPWPAAAC